MSELTIPAVEEISVYLNDDKDAVIKQYVSDQFIPGGEMWVVIPKDKISTIIRFLRELKKEIK